ncbi:nascent polypeptide-associated complex subunit alpha, muscle-specific form-like [Leguminivora glycinivorella]|uniref:nascent polypeptide-associated complex subunit alpha, muscle-specific form-like n=1 Tax=Leguminivora glycinivorella TaxID=1035111 RepID=UPI00200E39FF|nr:nascent polypeptide-associated complex subunit alpha, muscle-specific form-like [Leguminivora glycinivorella]
MLDEDAATLAARYSTSKALRETEATGKVIMSGPIYDIAVQVLGVDILKKLHTSGPAVDAKPTKQNQKALPDTEKMLSNATAPPEPTRSLLKPKVTSELMPKERKPVIANLGRVKLTPVTPVIAAPVVVPVGLIKNTNVEPAGEECILPDDDDVRIVTEPAPPPLAPRRAPRAASLLLNNAASAPAPRLMQDERLLTNIKVPIAPAAQAPNAVAIKVAVTRAPPAPAPAPATICLDSDDEDAPAPAPVPVTLTAATGARLELRMPHETPLDPQPRQPGPARPRRGATVCKPGDIIRISKAGNVEVLSPVDPAAGRLVRGARPAGAPAAPAAGPKSTPQKITPKSTPQRITPKSTPQKAAEPKTTPKPTEPAAKSTPKPAEKIAPKPADKPVRLDSGSSSSSRSASPVDGDPDPLSILKDVVQISADRFQSILSGQPAAEPRPTASRPTSSKTTGSTTSKTPQPPPSKMTLQPRLPK